MLSFRLCCEELMPFLAFLITKKDFCEVMSVLYSSKTGCFLSHEDYVNKIYKHVEYNGNIQCYTICKDLFKITNPFRSSKRNNRKRKLDAPKEEHSVGMEVYITQKEVNCIQERYLKFREEIKDFLTASEISKDDLKNEKAQAASKRIYDDSGRECVKNSFGENSADATIIAINGNNYLFPSNCKFFCKDVIDIDRHLIDLKYDLIVLDPPWWNKYVRRKKKATENHGYELMYNDNLQSLPIEKILNENGIVVVWCTNSLQNLQALQTFIFTKWNVNFLAKWYWIKVTQSGEPICDFEIPPKKQPFEQILIASRNSEHAIKCDNGKLVVSVPSALHSNKPPLAELLQDYLPQNPKCLEIFARYLLPSWTSWGNEVLRFQHECLYEKQK